ncbi:leucine-rich PPR motif-containing protein, mitochondrial [Bufo gargarizans]|uniref:leucine-rich PPR motif-containing protein, mitochondrial n=1 Tax=Bufo gargarizans TaxID=30331 RepID=UPI001CF1BC30|nr:leucine-rich PPR motif-containing protein, mitochondrial [Bufo gargarizans]
MAALLAGARLVLSQGVRLVPVYARRQSAVPVRCLSSSSRLFTLVAQEQGTADAESAPVARVRSWQEGPWSIHLIGSRLKRSGRVGRQKLLNTFEEVCKTGKPNSNQAWFFLRACGPFMPEVPPVERTEMASSIWNKLKELGVEFNVNHYNTLLEVYIHNEHVFSPTEFLANMEAANVEPDQGTYQGLIAAYCSEGDIDGASQILGFMKSKNFPITEEVFNSLIKGHARAGDMESAKNVLSIMHSAGMEPRWSTHVALLNAYAERGDIENIRQILSNSEINVPQKQLPSVIIALAKSGYSQYVPDVLEHMPNCISFSQDIINLCLVLLTHGYEDAALEVAKQLNGWKPADGNSESQPGDFFLRHCVNLKMPVSVLMKCADQMLAAEMHKQPKEFMLQCALRSSNSDLALELMRAMKDEGIPLRPRYFRSTLTQLRNRNDLQGLIHLLKTMKTQGVDVELDVLSKCIAWIFSEVNSGQAILQDKECLEDLDSVSLSAVRRGLFTGNLTNVHTFLSSSSTTISKDRNIVAALGAALLKYKDVDMIAKITGLLYKDGSDSKDSSRPTDFIGYLLYYVIDRMSGSEAQAMEEPLRQYFHQLKEMGLTIDTKQYRGIEKLLERHGVSQLNEDLKKLLKFSASPVVEPAENIAVLEEELANLKKENQPVESVLLKLLSSLRADKDLPKALQLKAKYGDDFTFGMYMRLLSICCEENNAQEALKVKREIDQKGFTAVPTTQKYVTLLRVLTENGLIEDAINILKEMQEKDVPMNEAATDYYFHILNNMALKGDAQALNLFHEYSVMMGLINPNGRMCAPLVMVHLKKNDVPASLNAMSECIEKYKCAPLLHDVLSILVEKGETDLLKKAVDRLSDFMGEQSMLHELFFAFIRAGKYSEAEKIAETPGLRAYPVKMSWFTDRCIRTNQVELLEKCVEISQKLFDCDREDLYFQLFKIYDKNNDWERAKSAWQKMKEESVLPQETTLNLLKSIFKKNGQDINVHIPELENTTKSVRGSGRRVIDLCMDGQITEAFAVFREAEQNNVPLTGRTYTSLVKALVKEGLLNEAAKVEAVAKNRVRNYSLRGTAGNLLIEEQVRRDCLKDALVTLQTMLENGSKPMRSTLNKLANALALNGDVPSLEKIKMLTERHELPAQVLPQSLNSCVVLAHLNSGNFEEGISMLESICINEPKKSYTSFLIGQLLKSNKEEALEKLSILAERLANQFANYGPVTDLFLNYVKAGREEAASHLLQRCGAIMEQRAQLARYINRQMGRNEEEEVTRLMELLSDPYYKQVLYSYKMKAYESNKEVEAAVSLYKKAKAEHIDPDELFLKRLAVLLRGAGRPVPFSEPPETIEYYKEKLKKQTSQNDEEQREE